MLLDCWHPQELPKNIESTRSFHSNKSKVRRICKSSAGFFNIWKWKWGEKERIDYGINADDQFQRSKLRSSVHHSVVTAGFAGHQSSSAGDLLQRVCQSPSSDVGFAVARTVSFVCAEWEKVDEINWTLLRWLQLSATFIINWRALTSAVVAIHPNLTF